MRITFNAKKLTLNSIANYRTRTTFVNQAPLCNSKFTYLDLGPNVPLRASGDEKSLSFTVTGDPAGSMPADTDTFQVFFESASPCLLRHPNLSSTVFWRPVHCFMCGSFSLLADDVASHCLAPCSDNVEQLEK